MKVVYVSAPYSADNEQEKKTLKSICSFCVRHGVIPLSPQMYFSSFCDCKASCKYKTEFVSNISEVLIKCCDEVWRFGETEGIVIDELIAAILSNKKIRYFAEEE